MKERHKKKNQSIKRSRQWIIIAALALASPVWALILFLWALGADSFQEDLTSYMSFRSGRPVAITGDMHWSYSLRDGLALTAQDIVIGNPDWASRRDMARIGKLRLQLDLVPLLRKQLHIKAVQILKTDVQVEFNEKGEGNWIFSPLVTDKTNSVAPRLSVLVRKAEVFDSRVGVKTADGKFSIYEIPQMEFMADANGVRASYYGSLNGVPAELHLAGDVLSGYEKRDWPFNLTGLYDKIKLEAEGFYNSAEQQAALHAFLLSSGSSRLAGKVSVNFKTNRPVIDGELKAKEIILADFLVAPPSITFEQTDEQLPPVQERFFTDRSISFEGLKTFDADLDISIGKLVVGLTEASDFKTKLKVQDGVFLAAPMSTIVAGSSVASFLRVDGRRTTPYISFAIKANDLDISQLVEMTGYTSFISGKSFVDIDIGTYGKTQREMAAHTNGKIELLMDTGSISSSQIREIAGTLLEFLAPGASTLIKPGVNCMAARYAIVNGIVETKGFLIDTDMTTISGDGYVNLPDERIDLSLFTRPKGLGLGSMIPPMRITGFLTAPHFTLEATDALGKISNIISNGGSGNGPVPPMVTVNGKNSCGVTLDQYPNPSTVVTSNSPLIPAGQGGIVNEVMGFGSSIWDNLQSYFLGN